MITLALRSCLSPRIGRSRAFSLPWSHSTRLLAYCSVRCHGRRQQLLQHDRVGRRSVGDDLNGCDLGRADGPLEEPTGCLGVAPRGDEHVDDLPELVDRAVDIRATARRPSHRSRPRASDLPRRGDTAGGLGQQRREPKHPPIDRDVVDLDATLGRAVPRGRGRTARSAGTSGPPSTITSGGKRKPAKADRCDSARTGRPAGLSRPVRDLDLGAHRPGAACADAARWGITYARFGFSGCPSDGGRSVAEPSAVTPANVPCPAGRHWRTAAAWPRRCRRIRRGRSGPGTGGDRACAAPVG